MERTGDDMKKKDSRPLHAGEFFISLQETAISNYCVFIEQFPRGVCTISSNNPSGTSSSESSINLHLLPASESP
jgi:hypothetical protein